MTDIIIRPFKGVEDHDQVYELQAEVWSRSTAVPTNLTIALQRHGGVVLGAFTPTGEMAGFVFGFTGQTDIPGAARGLHHHSHAAAVKPGLRGMGIGERLKRAQAEIVRAQSINLMTWTFDPLEARNAYFNLHKLGAIVVNCYGVMNDALNAGLPSDRFELEWWLDRDVRRDGLPGTLTPPSTSAPVDRRIRVPQDFQSIKKADLGEAKRIRLALRDQFERAFSEGYVATDFTLGDEAYYTLKRL
jgi:predicted GNAT superfamily acetyltransferase